jgi:hypothetical protein
MSYGCNVDIEGVVPNIFECPKGDIIKYPTKCKWLNMFNFRATITSPTMAVLVCVRYNYYIHITICMVTKRVWRYQRVNQNQHIEEEQTTQWPKEKLQVQYLCYQLLQYQHYTFRAFKYVWYSLYFRRHLLPFMETVAILKVLWPVYLCIIKVLS